LDDIANIDDIGTTKLLTDINTDNEILNQACTMSFSARNEQTG